MSQDINTTDISGDMSGMHSVPWKLSSLEDVPVCLSGGIHDDISLRVHITLLLEREDVNIL